MMRKLTEMLHLFGKEGMSLFQRLSRNVIYGDCCIVADIEHEHQMEGVTREVSYLLKRTNALGCRDDHMTFINTGYGHLVIAVTTFHPIEVKNIVTRVLARHGFDYVWMVRKGGEWKTSRWTELPELEIYADSPRYGRIMFCDGMDFMPNKLKVYPICMKDDLDIPPISGCEGVGMEAEIADNFTAKPRAM